MIFRQRYLAGQSAATRELAGLWTGAFDVAVVAPSWDRRCGCITHASSLRVRDSLVLSFQARDDGGLQEGHERSILRFLGDRSERIHRIEGDSIAVDVLWPKLWAALRAVAEGARAPLRILIDLSTCPRYYSLGVFAGAIRCGFAKSISVLYAEGRYQQPEGMHVRADFPFSLGEWRTVPVPYLEGMLNPKRKVYFVISAGFEGFKTSRVLATEDPDRVAILYPIPGTSPGYDADVRTRNLPIVDRYAIPESYQMSVAAGDAVAVWKALGEAQLERPDGENTSYLCCGTKPHALGLAARAICLRYPTVLYNVPDKHAPLDVYPTGVYWRYDFEDLSALPV